MSALRILAIDPSLNQTGICWMDGDTFTIKPLSKASPIDRLRDLRAQFKNMWHGLRINLVVLEDYAYSAKGSSIVQIAEWGGVLRLALSDAGYTVALVSPTALKKYATGKGNANKALVVSALTNRAGRQFDTDDEADAWGLWAMASDHYGQPVVKMPEAHRKALLSVAWPVVTQ